MGGWTKVSESYVHAALKAHGMDDHDSLWLRQSLMTKFLPMIATDQVLLSYSDVMRSFVAKAASIGGSFPQFHITHDFEGAASSTQAPALPRWNRVCAECGVGIRERLR